MIILSSGIKELSMKNGNGFWQTLKANFVLKRTRIIWKIITWIMRLGFIIFKILELLDKTNKP